VSDVFQGECRLYCFTDFTHLNLENDTGTGAQQGQLITYTFIMPVHNKIKYS